MKQTRPLCLASASPRRRELLERFGLSVSTYFPRIDEEPLAGESPHALATRLAEAKAAAALDEHPEHLVLAGDTVVVHEGAILGKPGDAEDAARMLTALSGRTHQVISAYRLEDGKTGIGRGDTVETRVTFRKLPPQWIQWYSRLDEPLDKAGAYGIQGIGGAMVAGIDGSYTNVVGFPVERIIWDMIEQGWITL